MKDRNHRVLLVIFIAFLAVTLPTVTIPVDIGEHSYTGGIYDSDTGEQMEAVTVTLGAGSIRSGGPHRHRSRDLPK